MDQIIKRSRWSFKNRWWVFGLLLPVIALALYSFGKSENNGVEIKKQELTIGMVKKVNFIEYISLEGAVQPLRSIYLDAVDGGVVQKIYVEDGALVHQGEKIMELSNTNLQLDIMQREAHLLELINQMQNTRLDYEKNKTTLLAQLADLQYNVETGERLYKINQQLITDRIISRQEYEESASKFRYASNKLLLTKKALMQDSISSMEHTKQLSSSISRMNSNLEMVKTKLDNLTIKAPAEGKLTSFPPSESFAIWKG